MNFFGLAVTKDIFLYLIPLFDPFPRIMITKQSYLDIFSRHIHNCLAVKTSMRFTLDRLRYMMLA